MKKNSNNNIVFQIQLFLESSGSHSTDVRTVSFVESRPIVSLEAFERWFAHILWETDGRASELFRIKGGTFFIIFFLNLDFCF